MKAAPTAKSQPNLCIPLSGAGTEEPALPLQLLHWLNGVAKSSFSRASPSPIEFLACQSQLPVPFIG